jgi:hypothetical protein
MVMAPRRNREPQLLKRLGTSRLVKLGVSIPLAVGLIWLSARGIGTFLGLGKRIVWACPPSMAAKRDQKRL